MVVRIPFLTATWRYLLVSNYEVAPELLVPHLPLGTELDLFQGKALVSIVAFHFSKNKLFGIVPTVPVTQFEEVNLRFYVRRRVGDEVRRGVVFIKEVVPSTIIATTARWLYNEPYEARRMWHDMRNCGPTTGGHVAYGVEVDGNDTEISARTEGPLRSLETDSIESFILEHYWGYTPRGDGTTSEYEVQHEPWRFWRIADLSVGEHLPRLYPVNLREFLQGQPHSAFLALGSPVSVYGYNRFRARYDTRAVPQGAREGWVLYDGLCGFCSWWVPKIQDRLARAGFSIAPLQAAWVRETIAMPDSQRTSDIRLLLTDGTLVSGADAYIYCLKRMPYLRVFGMLLGLPGMRWLTWQVYRVVNHNRFLISRVCRLSPEQADAK